MAGAIKTYSLLIIVFVLACGVGVGHHLFYAILDGKVVENQSWVVRAGTAIAYLAKLLFVTSIGTAFTQQIWQSMRSKFYTLGAIDSLFGLKNDPLKFFSWEIFTKAKLVLVMAASIWVFPLLPIIAPGSISVRAIEGIEPSSVIWTQTLNFSRSQISPLLSITNFTGDLVKTPGIGPDPTAYIGPSPPINGLVYGTIYGGQVLSTDSPCGANCTFNQSFVGPAYKCRDVDYTQNSEPNNPFCLEIANGPMNGTISCESYFDFGPHFNNNAFDTTWYYARNSSRLCPDCFEPWVDGKIWVLYQYLLPQYRIQAVDFPANSTPIPESAWEKHQFVCQSYNARFDIERTYINYQQIIRHNTTFLYPVPFGREHLRSDMLSYASYAIHQNLYSILSGQIIPNGRRAPTDSSGLSGTRLVEEVPFPRLNATMTGLNGIQKPIRDLRTAIEELHFNITVSMLKIPNLMYLQDETVNATVKTFANRWGYNWVPLAAIYGACALINLCAIVVAVMAIWDNGGVGVDSSGFLRIMMTTRNRTLDTLVGNKGQGDDDMRTEVAGTMVKFGELVGVNEKGRPKGDSATSVMVGFGVQGEVVDLRKRH
ncbi:hypothetical protein DL95DRAFT_398852 [Leptodontidium sp. 2 PMI_412]|nr:hypothetical protein DL95DRAFT_398852 [Leptodontidium sp. 2 PMI_412]